MTASTPAKPCQSTTAARRNMPEAYYQLHSLLLTLRNLASHEDEICTLLADMERSGTLSASVRRDLNKLLATLPVHSLHQELDDLAGAMEQRAA